MKRRTVGVVGAMWSPALPGIESVRTAHAVPRWQRTDGGLRLARGQALVLPEERAEDSNRAASPSALSPPILAGLACCFRRVRERFRNSGARLNRKFTTLAALGFLQQRLLRSDPNGCSPRRFGARGSVENYRRGAGRSA